MRIRLFLAVFPALLALAAPAFARGTLDSILPGIRAQHPGRLSDAEPWTDQDGSTHYRIKWMTPDGRILYFDADSRTGRYTNAGGGDGNRWREREGGRGRDDGAASDDSHRGHWNDDGDWHRSGGDGNWRHGGDSGDGGNWHGGGNGHGGGNWHGRDGGGWGGGRGGWHGGYNGGGGHGHHGG